MLALGLGIKVWHIVALVVWFIFCCYIIWNEYENEGEDFLPAAGSGCGAFFFAPPLLYGFWLLIKWVIGLLQFEVF
jgi:hypothetical protein